MYARVSAKKAKLYTEKDYSQFLKMDVNEISRKMEEGEYSEEINQLGSELSGAALIENALNLSLSNTFQHLLDISSEDAKPIIKAYNRRFDLESYKKILRWKQNGQKKSINNLVHNIEGLGIDREELEEMSLEDLKNKISFPEALVDYQDAIKDCNSIKEVENCLDKAYAREMRELSNKVQSSEFKKYIKNEQFYQDVKLALRLKKYGADEESIMERMVSEDLEDLQDIIYSSSFEDAIGEAEKITGVEGDNLEELEHCIKQKRLQEAVSTLHREPLGLSSVIGYMVAKTIEVENLRMIARAKETGIQNQDTIKDNLVLN